MRISLSRSVSVLSLLSVVLAGLLVLSALPQHAAPPAPATGIILVEFDSGQCTVHWTLGTTLHTVHGTFALEKGAVQLDPTTGKASGEIVVHATSGDSGNDSRDRKMHKEVLESGRYPEIVFRPDRFEGKLAQEGPSSLQVHGTFLLHGAKHEMTVSVQGELSGDRWTGRAKFGIPFIDWGLKNPSSFFLKVNHTVDIDLELQGKLQIMAAPQA
ncbi:MAG TPA: YceI family protein [Candidatus Acidoferrum sp.]|nr:YceI family protein [Candidatus Acidoferrum sp.]